MRRHCFGSSCGASFLASNYFNGYEIKFIQKWYYGITHICKENTNLFSSITDKQRYTLFNVLSELNSNFMYSKQMKENKKNKAFNRRGTKQWLCAVGEAALLEYLPAKYREIVYKDILVGYDAQKANEDEIVSKINHLLELDDEQVSTEFRNAVAGLFNLKQK